MTLNLGKAGQGIPDYPDYDGVLRILAHLVRSMGGSVAISPSEYAKIFMGPPPTFETARYQDPYSFVIKVVDNDDDQQRNV